MGWRASDGHDGVSYQRASRRYKPASLGRGVVKPGQGRGDLVLARAAAEGALSQPDAAEPAAEPTSKPAAEPAAEPAVEPAFGESAGGQSPTSASRGCACGPFAFAAHQRGQLPRQRQESIGAGGEDKSTLRVSQHGGTEL